MESVYYNDNDAYCCQWLRNLIDAGELPDGNVDERSIKDVDANGLHVYGQAHFFAGIGGWPLALRMAGWPAEVDVWTGSCPCQPISSAGKRKGHADERHLWPAYFGLIRQCRPAICLGEQVASKDGLEWLDGVFADLEDEGYACGASDLCAAGIGAPHARQRLYWVAYARCGKTWRSGPREGNQTNTAQEGNWPREGKPERRGKALPVANANSTQLQRIPSSRKQSINERHDGPLRLDDAEGARPQGRRSIGSSAVANQRGQLARLPSGAWDVFDLISRVDNKACRIESGVLPVAARLPRSVGPGSTREQRVELLAAKANRVARIRGYGNAICVPVAVEFTKVCMEVLGIGGENQ